MKWHLKVCSHIYDRTHIVWVFILLSISVFGFKAITYYHYHVYHVNKFQYFDLQCRIVIVLKIWLINNILCAYCLFLSSVYIVRCRAIPYWCSTLKGTWCTRSGYTEWTIWNPGFNISISCKYVFDHISCHIIFVLN